MLESLESIKKQISELDKLLKRKGKKIDELEKVLKEKDEELDELQQYFRRDCIEITGIPVTFNGTKQLNRKEKGELIGLSDITVHHIPIAHRLPSTKKVKDTMIVKFIYIGK